MPSRETRHVLRPFAASACSREYPEFVGGTFWAFTNAEHDEILRTWRAIAALRPTDFSGSCRSDVEVLQSALSEIQDLANRWAEVLTICGIGSESFNPVVSADREDVILPDEIVVLRREVFVAYDRWIVACRTTPAPGPTEPAPPSVAGVSIPWSRWPIKRGVVVASRPRVVPPDEGGAAGGGAAGGAAAGGGAETGEPPGGETDAGFSPPVVRAGGGVGKALLVGLGIAGALVGGAYVYKRSRRRKS